jgi:hypothetical protein
MVDATPILQGLAVASGPPPSEPWQVGVGAQPSAAAEPSPTPAEQQEDAECAAEEEVSARAKQRGKAAARNHRAEGRRHRRAPDSKSGSDMSLRVSVGHTSLDDSRTAPAVASLVTAAPPVTATPPVTAMVSKGGKGGGSGGGGGKGSGFGKGSHHGGKGKGMHGGKGKGVHGGKGKGMRGGKGKGTHSQGGTGKGWTSLAPVAFSAAAASSTAIIAPTAVSAAAAAAPASVAVPASVAAPAPVSNALTGPAATATANSLELLCHAINGARCRLRRYQVADTRLGRGELLRTDAGQLPWFTVVGGALRVASPRVDLHFHARRPSGCESRFGASRLELEPSSKTVTCGLRTELPLKIVSDLKQARQGKKGIGAQWCQRRKELEAEGGEEHGEELHLHPENPFAYELVVQAFRSSTTLAVSAELVLGPFEVFNNATSAVRCTPHATRRTLHATRYTLHATRRPSTPPSASHSLHASTVESRL